MSATSVGKAFEKKIEAFLTERGYTVMRTWPKYSFFKKPGQQNMTIITRRQDFFGCADLVAIRPDRTQTFFIQCTCGEASHRRPKVEALPWNFTAHNVTLWKRMDADKQAVKIYRLTAGGLWTDNIYHFRNKNDEVLTLNGI